MSADPTAYRAAEATFWASIDRSPRDQQVRLAATGTTVRVQEVGEGEPVLFIHGGPNAGASLDAERMPRAFLTWYLTLQRHTDTMRHDGDLIGRVVPHRTSVTLTDDLLRTVSTPTLFWWGRADTVGGEDVARHLVAVTQP